LVDKGHGGGGWYNYIFRQLPQAQIVQGIAAKIGCLRGILGVNAKITFEGAGAGMRGLWFGKHGAHDLWNGVYF
jgi:hypothetical protein